MLVTLLLYNGCTGSRSPGAMPTATLQESGEHLYVTRCQVCHGDQQQDIGRLPLAPSHGPDGHTWHHPDGQLIQIIMDGTKAIRESMGLPPSTPEMPPFREQLTNEEVLAILSFIKTWWTEEQRDFQAEISRQWQEAN